MMQEIEAIGKLAGSSVGGAMVALLIALVWAKKTGIIDFFRDEKIKAGCQDPVCQANVLSRAERQADLEEHVYEVITPKLTKIGEDVAYIRGKLEIGKDVAYIRWKLEE